MTSAVAPIGVFDSGIGGLSVLEALRHEMPHEHFVYLADSANAPYGERGDAFVLARTCSIAAYLRQQHSIKALVIACNTATAAAVEALRSAMPEIAMIGVEPAIKPAAQSSQTHHVGVMATRGTVESARFKKLLHEHGQGVHFHVQACDGLAHAIERSAHTTSAEHGMIDADVAALCAQYTHALGAFGLKTSQMDTLVLGCTHYVFAKPELRALLGPDVQLMDTSAAVARQTRRLLGRNHLLRPETTPGEAHAIAGPEQIQLMTTGTLAALQAAAKRWLSLPATCCATAAIDTSKTFSPQL